MAPFNGLNSSPQIDDECQQHNAMALPTAAAAELMDVETKEEAKNQPPSAEDNINGRDELQLGTADGIRMRINGKWLWLNQEFIKSHPGGAVLTQYKDNDATHIFHAFHEGSALAYKQLALLERRATKFPNDDEQQQQQETRHEMANKEISDQMVVEEFDEAKVVAEYKMPLEKEKEIVLEFEKLRQQVHAEGLMHARASFYVRKIGEAFGLMAFAFWLQYRTLYVPSAMVLALCWQQLGWLCHEFCHHQPTKNRRFNDALSLVLGNLAQGFSRDWWKDKHNLHHAATNIIERDGDIDLAPLLALVPDDLGKYKTLIHKLLLRIILPYQHWYFTAIYPLLRPSWTSQSIAHAFSASSSQFKKHRAVATTEKIFLLAHWLWVFAQLWLLPSMPIRILYFAISQFGAGLLIALVVSYNHNSVPKFAVNSGLLNNFAALHLLTTRNMRSSLFVDWFWGGLNFQIEHHLFPTMPRPNLPRCSLLVRRFCAKTGLPYMEDDFLTGYLASIRLLRQVSEKAVAQRQKRSTTKRG